MNSFSSSNEKPIFVTFAATAIAVCFVTWTSAAFAQLRANDLAGVHLGASPKEVENALRSLDSRFKFLTVYYADANGKASSSIAVLKAAVQAGNDLRGIDWKRNGFAVYFGESNAKAYAIYRQVYNAEGISIPQTVQDLTKKYGPNTGTYPEIYVRSTDSGGKTGANCSGSGFSWQSGPRGFDANCGQALKVQFDSKLPGVAVGFQSWLFDNQLAREAMEGSQAKQNAETQELIRRQQEKVRGNRPAI